MRNVIAILLGLTFASGAALAAEMPTFEEVDSDGNGKLSESEAAAAGIDVKVADADGNGTLSQAEFKAALETMEKSGSDS